MAKIVLDRFQIVLLVILASLYVATCVRVALRARKSGRNGLKWFFITLFLTAIPAAIVASRDRFRNLRAEEQGRFRHSRFAGPPAAAPSPTERCPHCQGIITAAEVRASSPVKTCPHCGLAIEEGKHA